MRARLNPASPIARMVRNGAALVPGGRYGALERTALAILVRFRQLIPLQDIEVNHGCCAD
jgi:hypothetical protein